MSPDPIYKEIGVIIRGRRKALNLTQEALAKKLGISRGALANIETGRQNILVHQIYKYASVLGLNMIDLLPIARRETQPVEMDQVPIPHNVNRSQAEQIVRLIQEATTDAKQPAEVRRGK